MPYMGLRSIFITCFLLFLFLILPLPTFSRVDAEALHYSEVYEIDYRGPETHSWVPPPHRSRAFPHQQTNPIPPHHTPNKG